MLFPFLLIVCNVIAHLVMVNVVVALKFWGHLWAKICCDNRDVVDVLSFGRARDSVLAACARSVWLLAAMYNINMVVSHIAGLNNTAVDLLSRWRRTTQDFAKLNQLVDSPLWVYTHIDLTLLNYYIWHCVLYVSDPEAVTAPLAAYKRMFQLFMSFVVALGLSLPQRSTLDLLAFIEYLLQSGMSASHISNHLTAIRSMCIIYNCNTTPFRDNRLPLFIKAVKLNRPLQPKLPFVINEGLLQDVVVACASLHPAIIFKALYLLAFILF